MYHRVQLGESSITEPRMGNLKHVNDVSLLNSFY